MGLHSAFCPTCTCIDPNEWKYLKVGDSGLLVRMNTNGKDPEAFSLNNKDAVWGNEVDIRAQLTANAQGIMPLTCGVMHKNTWGSTGYDDPNHWCSLALKLLKPTPTQPAPKPAPAPTPTPSTGIPTSNPLAKNWSVAVDNGSEVEIKTPGAEFTDGFCPIIKNPNGDGFILYLSEAQSFVGYSKNPTFESVNGNWKKIFGNHPESGTGPWPDLTPNSSYNGGCWLMYVRYVNGKYIGFAHTEERNNWEQKGMGGLPVQKAIQYLTSKDAVNWTEPVTLLSKGRYKQQQNFGGIGDFSAVFKDNYYYIIFHSSNGIGVARSSDPEARPATFTFYKDGNWNGDVNNYTSVLTSVTGGNPSVSWSHHLGGFVMTVVPWRSDGIYVGLSKDLINWDVKKLDIQPYPRGPNGAWVYPQFVDLQFGTESLGEKCAIYYSNTTGGRRRMCRKLVTFKRT